MEDVRSIQTKEAQKAREAYFTHFIKAQYFQPFERRYHRDKMKDSASYALVSYTGQKAN